jgi:hypothetical protein
MEDNVSRDKHSTLTEWDFDIPPDNRFHDPFRWQDQEVKCSEDSSSGSQLSQIMLPKQK